MGGSREIKFRRWTGDHYHYYDQYNLSCYHEEWSEDNLNACLIEQYTGLKDKNGKEIYEGDKVNCWECGYEDEKEEYKIVYMAHQDYPAFDLWPQPDVESNGLSHYLACGEIEIIGNIHEADHE